MLEVGDGYEKNRMFGRMIKKVKVACDNQCGACCTRKRLELVLHRYTT